MFKGIVPALMRAIPNWSTFFWTNEFLKEKIGINEAKQRGEDWSTSNLLKRISIGGTSGLVSWSIAYPFDVVKTEIMCTTTHKMTIREAFAKGYASEGRRYFYKGLTPCLQRAFVVNGITLPAFEYMTQHWVPMR